MRGDAPEAAAACVPAGRLLRGAVTSDFSYFLVRFYTFHVLYPEHA